MRRTWPILVLFGACLAGVLGAMGWVTVVAIDLDRREAGLALQAEREENIRLALWRMESILIPLITQENARSYLEFSPLYAPIGAIDAQKNAPVSGPVLLPSPLLTRRVEHVFLYFQVESDGRVSSPQLPIGDARDTIQRLFGEVDPEGRARGLLEQVERWGDAASLFASAPRPQPVIEISEGVGLQLDTVGVYKRAEDLPQYGLSQDPVQADSERGAPLKQAGLAANSVSQQSLRNTVEKSQRMRALDNSYTLNQVQTGVGQGAVAAPIPQSTLDFDLDSARLAVAQGGFSPVWFHGELLLVRRVTDGLAESVQGVWFDWPTLRSWLVGEVLDLLPEAELAPVVPGTQDDGSDESHVLASVPIRLIPGQLPAAPPRLSAPIRNSLVLAWACALLGSAAVAVLLWGIVGLSERRNDFVSSVTHELRTPLTTLQMYTELLAGGMVKDETKRAAYLDTLQHESIRLGRLIENVMSYARLERGRPADRAEQLRVDQVVDRLRDRLTALSARHGMELVIRVDPGVGERVMRTNATAADQILSNLVDNACKYAQQTDDPCVELAVDTDGANIRFRVMDHGPGLSQDAVRRLFKPFSKSPDAAASSAPGIGLGLALSRRLARQLGGRLTLDPSYRDGCCFVLTLPVDTSG